MSATPSPATLIVRGPIVGGTIVHGPIVCSPIISDAIVHNAHCPRLLSLANQSSATPIVHDAIIYHAHYPKRPSSAIPPLATHIISGAHRPWPHSSLSAGLSLTLPIVHESIVPSPIVVDLLGRDLHLFLYILLLQ